MIRNNIIYTLALTTLIVFSLTAPTGAGLVSDDLVKEGIRFYEAGDYTTAIHQFSKVLIFDPENEMAREYLQKMGLNDGLYAPEQGRGSSQGGSREIWDYQSQINALEAEKIEQQQLAQDLAGEKESLQEAIETKNKELENLREEMAEMQTEMADQDALHESMATDAQKTSQKFAQMDENSYRLKDRMGRQATLIDQKDQQIKKLKNDLKLAERKTKKEGLKYEHKLIDADRKYRQYQSKVWKEEVKANQKIELLRSRLPKNRDDINRLNDDLLLANRKITSLENQLLLKNGRIDELNQSLLERKNACPEPRAADPAQISIEDGLLKDCPDREFLKEQDVKIADLKARLAKAQKEITTLRQSVRKSGEEDVAALKQQLATLETELKEKDLTLADEEASYLVLEERLRDAQERLSVANEMIQEKDEQIKVLEQQINDIGGAE